MAVVSTTKGAGGGGYSFKLLGLSHFTTLIAHRGGGGGGGETRCLSGDGSDLKITKDTSWRNQEQKQARSTHSATPTPAAQEEGTKFEGDHIIKVLQKSRQPPTPPPPPLPPRCPPKTNEGQNPHAPFSYLGGTHPTVMLVGVADTIVGAGLGVEGGDIRVRSSASLEGTP